MKTDRSPYSFTRNRPFISISDELSLEERAAVFSMFSCANFPRNYAQCSAIHELEKNITNTGYTWKQLERIAQDTPGQGKMESYGGSVCSGRSNGPK